MEESGQERAKFARFVKNKDGVFSIEMAVLLAPLMLSALFVLDIARAYIIGSSLDAVTTKIMSKARLGDLANLKRDTFCDDFNITFCDMDKFGLRIEPLAYQYTGKPSPGEFSVNPPPGKDPVLIKLQVRVDPFFKYGRSEDAFFVSAGAFTHAN